MFAPAGGGPHPRAAGIAADVHRISDNIEGMRREIETCARRWRAFTRRSPASAGPRSEILTFKGGKIARVEVYFGWDLPE
jgi:hypothetical protein